MFPLNIFVAYNLGKFANCRNPDKLYLRIQNHTLQHPDRNLVFSGHHIRNSKYLAEAVTRLKIEARLVQNYFETVAQYEKSETVNVSFRRRQG